MDGDTTGVATTGGGDARLINARLRQIGVRFTPRPPTPTPTPMPTRFMLTRTHLWPCSEGTRSTTVVRTPSAEAVGGGGGVLAGRGEKREVVGWCGGVTSGGSVLRWGVGALGVSRSSG